MKAIVLAAGVGKRFGKRTKKLPKCLIPLGEKGYTLLSRYLDAFRVCGIQDVIIVVGHESQKIRTECQQKGKGLKIKFVVNPAFKKGSIYSLFKASKEMDDDCLVMDADVYFAPTALKKLITSKNKTAFLLDKKSISSGEEMMLMRRGERPVHIAKKVDPTLKIIGEATGIFKVSKKDVKSLAQILAQHVSRGNVRAEYEEAYCDLMKKTKVGYETIQGFWTEMDFEEDLTKILHHESKK